MADYDMQDLVHELNFESAKIARNVVDEFKTNDSQEVFVAGVLGPTNRTCSLSPDVEDPSFRNITFDEIVETFKAATSALIDGGADLIMGETIFDTLNAKAALFAIDLVASERGIDIPIMISGTITDASGRTLSGPVSYTHLTLPTILLV